MSERGRLRTVRGVPALSAPSIHQNSSSLSASAQRKPPGHSGGSPLQDCDDPREPRRLELFISRPRSEGYLPEMRRFVFSRNLSGIIALRRGRVPTESGWGPKDVASLTGLLLASHTPRRRPGALDDRTYRVDSLHQATTRSGRLLFDGSRMATGGRARLPSLAPRSPAKVLEVPSKRELETGICPPLPRARAAARPPPQILPPQTVPTAPPAPPHLRDASATQPTLLDTRRRREARSESPFVARCRDVRVGNPGAKHVYLTTATWCDVYVTGDVGVCWPSLDTIRHATEFGRTAFMEHWSYLSGLGLIVTKRGSGKKIVRTPDGALRPVGLDREVPDSGTSDRVGLGEKCRNPAPEKCRNPAHNRTGSQVAFNALPGCTTPGAPGRWTPARPGDGRAAEFTRRSRRALQRGHSRTPPRIGASWLRSWRRRSGARPSPHPSRSPPSASPRRPFPQRPNRQSSDRTRQ